MEVAFIFEQLSMNNGMSIDDIQSKLVKQSMHYWKKEMKHFYQVAIDKQGKFRTYFTYRSTFKKELQSGPVTSRGR